MEIPPNESEDQSETPLDETAGDDGVIGEISGTEEQEAPPEPRRRRPRGRRSLMIGCLLALLGALAGGGLALWISRGGQEETTGQKQVVSPAQSQQPPGNRLVFAATPKRPEATPDIISAETDVIYCFYEIGQLPAEAPLRATWTHDGQSLGELPLAGHRRDTEVTYARGRFSITPPEADDGGFPLGIYEVELTSPEFPDVIVTGSFVALPRSAQILHGGGEPEGPPVIRSLQTATGVSEDGEPIGRSASFPADVGRITAVFAYSGIPAGSVLTVRWYHEGRELKGARSEIAVTSSEGRAEAWLEVGGQQRLPTGQYRVSVHYGEEAESLATTSFKVTPTGNATDPPAE